MSYTRQASQRTTTSKDLKQSDRHDSDAYINPTSFSRTCKIAKRNSNMSPAFSRRLRQMFSQSDSSETRQVVWMTPHSDTHGCPSCHQKTNDTDTNVEVITTGIKSKSNLFVWMTSRTMHRSCCSNRLISRLLNNLTSGSRPYRKCCSVPRQESPVKSLSDVDVGNSGEKAECGLEFSQITLASCCTSSYGLNTTGLGVSCRQDNCIMNQESQFSAALTDVTENRRSDLDDSSGLSRLVKFSVVDSHSPICLKRKPVYSKVDDRRFIKNGHSNRSSKTKYRSISSRESKRKQNKNDNCMSSYSTLTSNETPEFPNLAIDQTITVDSENSDLSSPASLDHNQVGSCSQERNNAKMRPSSSTQYSDSGHIRDGRSCQELDEMNATDVETAAMYNLHQQLVILRTLLGDNDKIIKKMAEDLMYYTTYVQELYDQAKMNDKALNRICVMSTYLRNKKHWTSCEKGVHLRRAVSCDDLVPGHVILTKIKVPKQITLPRYLHLNPSDLLVEYQVGFLVKRLNPHSLMYQSGVRVGDLVTQLEHCPVTQMSTCQFVAMVNEACMTNDVVVTVLTNPE